MPLCLRSSSSSSLLLQQCIEAWHRVRHLTDQLLWQLHLPNLLLCMALLLSLCSAPLLWGRRRVVRCDSW